MDKEKQIEFFNKVKGKKIRWFSWDKDEYCIPSELLANGDFHAKHFKDDKLRYSSRRSMGRGIGSSEMSRVWILLEEESTPVKSLDKRNCNCNSWDLFNFGCKCGGV